MDLFSLIYLCNHLFRPFWTPGYLFDPMRSNPIQFVLICFSVLALTTGGPFGLAPASPPQLCLLFLPPPHGFHHLPVLFQSTGTCHNLRRPGWHPPRDDPETPEFNARFLHTHLGQGAVHLAWKPPGKRGWKTPSNMTHESLWEAGTVVDGLQISDGEVVDSGSLGVETSLLVGAHSQMEIGATS